MSFAGLPGGASPGMPEYGSIPDRLANLERAVHMLGRASPLESSSISRGGLRVKDGGAITCVGDDGEPLAVFDADGVHLLDAAGAEIATFDRAGVRFNDGSEVRLAQLSPTGLRFYQSNGTTVRTLLDRDGLDIANGLVVVDGSGLTVGNAPVVVDANGLTVGTDVVIDAAGLKIDGVLQPAIETIRASGSFQNVSLGTSFTNLVSLNLTIPSFATVVDVMAIGRLQVANTSGGIQSFEARSSVAGGSTDTARDYADNNLSSNVTATRADRVTGSPSTVNVLLEGRVTSGSNSSNVGRLNVMAVARRVA